MDVWIFNGTAQIHPEDWADLCRNLPIRNDQWSPCPDMSPELARTAREELADTLDVDAVQPTTPLLVRS